MSNYNSLKTTINANVKQNGRQEITGSILNSVLNAMVNTLGAGYQFAGVATTATNPGSPDAKVFYIANGKGTYTNFGGLQVTEDDVVVLYWDSSWHKVSTGIASQEKLSELDSELDGLNTLLYVPSSDNITRSASVPHLVPNLESGVFAYSSSIHTEYVTLNKGRYRFGGKSIGVYPADIYIGTASSTPAEGGAFTNAKYEAWKVGEDGTIMIEVDSDNTIVFISFMTSRVENPVLYQLAFSPTLAYSFASIINGGLGGVTELSRDVIWEDYGINRDGSLGTSTTFKHSSPIIVEKGDIVICESSSSVSSSYCSIASVKGDSFVPKVLEDNNFSLIIYVADGADTISLTARGTITFKMYHSDTLGTMAKATEKASHDALIASKHELSQDRRMDNPLYAEWEIGYLASANGAETTSSTRIRTKGYLYIGNLKRLRFHPHNGVSYTIHYYDENKNWLGLDAISSVEKVIDLEYANTILQKDAKFIRYWITSTNEGDFSVCGDSLFSALNYYFLERNKNVKVASHQGLGVGVNNAGTRLTSGNNFLSAFWGAYRAGFDINLVNQQFSSDGVCYCSHDSSFVDEITGNTIVFSQHTSTEIDACRVRGEKIPTLESVVYLSKMLGMGLWLVNAGATNWSSTQRQNIRNLIKKYQMWDNTIFMINPTLASEYTNDCPNVKLAICQSEISSTDYSQITALFTLATEIKTATNEVYIWVNGEHSEQNLINASLNLPAGIKIGAYNVATENIMKVAPYVNIFSSHTMSFGAVRRNVELALAEKYPDAFGKAFSGII